jgi:hypothetical protein
MGVETCVDVASKEALASSEKRLEGTIVHGWITERGRVSNVIFPLLLGSFHGIGLQELLHA